MDTHAIDTPTDPCGCGSTRYRIRWHRHRDGRRHIRCDCGRCGQWLGWLEQTAVTRAFADLGGIYVPERRPADVRQGADPMVTGWRGAWALVDNCRDVSPRPRQGCLDDLI